MNLPLLGVILLLVISPISFAQERLCRDVFSGELESSQSSLNSTTNLWSEFKIYNAIVKLNEENTPVTVTATNIFLQRLQNYLRMKGVEASLVDHKSAISPDYSILIFDPIPGGQGLNLMAYSLKQNYQTELVFDPAYLVKRSSAAYASQGRIGLDMESIENLRASTSLLHEARHMKVNSMVSDGKYPLFFSWIKTSYDMNGLGIYKNGYRLDEISSYAQEIRYSLAKKKKEDVGLFSQFNQVKSQYGTLSHRLEDLKKVLANKDTYFGKLLQSTRSLVSKEYDYAQLEKEVIELQDLQKNLLKFYSEFITSYQVQQYLKLIENFAGQYRFVCEESFKEDQYEIESFTKDEAIFSNGPQGYEKYHSFHLYREEQNGLYTLESYDKARKDSISFKLLMKKSKSDPEKNWKMLMSQARRSFAVRIELLKSIEDSIRSLRQSIADQDLENFEQQYQKLMSLVAQGYSP